MTLVVAGTQQRGARALRHLVLALVALCAGVLLACSAGATPALAHAELEGTTPASGAVLETAPASVELQFSEPVQLIEGTIRLFPGGDGANPPPDPIDLDAQVTDATVTIKLPRDLADGAYAVSYRLVSADGHPIGGALTFQVGEGTFDAPTVTTPVSNPVVSDVIVSALTAVQYMGLLAFAGLLFFERIVLRSVRPDGERPDPVTRKLLRNAYGAAAISALLLLPASGSRTTGNEFMSFNAQTGDFLILPPSGWWPGVSWQVIASAVLITVLGWIALIIGTRVRHPGNWGARSATGAGARMGAGAIASTALAFAALLAPALVGHTQTIHPTWAMLIADIGHLTAGAFWVGGVIGLVRFLVSASPAARGDNPRIAPQRAARVVATFSRYALVSVIVLAASGLLMAVLIIGSWAALFGTAYGLTLFIKLGIVVVVVALAAVNRTRLVPQIMSHPNAPRQWVSLKRIMIAEVVLLIGVLAVTGFLTNATPRLAAQGADQVGAGSADTGQANTGSANTGQQPAGDGAANTAVRSASQGLVVEGTLTPAKSGENVFAFTLSYEEAPVSPDTVELAAVTVDARNSEQGLGPLDAEIAYDADAQQYTATVDLPVAGNWQLQVAVRVDTFTQPIVVLPVTVLQ